MGVFLAGYRLLLRFYPRVLRARYASELESCFAEQYALERDRRGIRGALIYVVRAYVDAPVSALRMRWTGRGSVRRETRKGIPVMERLWFDVRYALRGLARNPGLTALAALSLGLGVGANATMLGMVNGVVWRELPVPGPGQLVRVFERYPDEYSNVSYPNFETLRDGADDVFEGVIMHRLEGFSLRVGEASEVVYGEVVSADYFDVLGVRPQVGRFFTESESGGEAGAAQVVLSDHLWRTRFSADPSIIGRDVRLNDHVLTVAGVAPQDFDGTKLGLGMDAWVPVRPWGRLEGWTQFESRGDRWLNVVARLRPGFTREQAQERVSAVAASIAVDYPEQFSQLRLSVFGESEAAASPEAAHGLVLIGWLAIAASLLVLLVACGNVASLLLARGMGRRHETGLRMAIGAGSGTLVRQLFIEGMLLAALGGAVGIVSAFWTSRALFAYMPAIPYRLAMNTAPDARVIAIAGAIALACAFIFGLLPALDAVRTDPAAAIRGHSARARRFSGMRGLGGIVVGMVAFSFVSLVLTGLFVRSLGEARRIDTGFAVEGRLYATLDVSLAGDSGLDAHSFYRDVQRQLAATPGITSAAVTSALPLGDRSNASRLYAVGRDYGPEEVGINAWRASVSPEYFEVMGTAVTAGTSFGSEHRRGGIAAAIINRTLADRLWPGENPVGRSIRFSRESDDRGLQVIGVVADGKYGMVAEQPQPALFVPFDQAPWRMADVIIRTAGDPAAMAPALREAVASVDARVPVAQTWTSERHVESAMWMFRLGAGLGTGLGLLALVLAAAGLYGVMAYTVGRRHRELGIRMALGARAAQVVRMVLIRGLGLAAVGALIGLILALAAGSVLSSVLFGVGGRDPVTYIVVTFALGGAALGASLLPAWSASRTDPVQVLRADG